MEFSEIFNRRIGIRGLSKAEVARRLKLSSPTITDWAAGKFVPKDLNLSRLAKLLELSTSQLRGEADIEPSLLFKDAAEAEEAGYAWKDPIKPPPPQPYQPEDQEPGRFLIRANLEDCELLSLFHQMDVRARRDLIDHVHDVLRDLK